MYISTVSLAQGPEVGGPRALGYAWSLECWLEKERGALSCLREDALLRFLRQGLFNRFPLQLYDWDI